MPPVTIPTPIPVEDALRQSALDISVPADGSLRVGPFEEPYAHGFRLLEIRTYVDLQHLGLLPKVPEDQLVKAFYADDRVFREAIQQRTLGDDGHPCSCEEPRTRSSSGFRRRHMQNHMIEVLQPNSRRALRSDDLLVLHTYGQVRAWLNRPARYLLGAFVVNNMTVGDRGTLTMTPTVRYVRANDISLGKNSNLTFESGSIHVNCQTLNGPGLFEATPYNPLAKHILGLARERQENRP